MPYLIGKYEGNGKQLENKSAFGPKFDEADVAKASVLKIWGSSFNDPGADWCRYELLDQDGNVFESRTVSGY